MHSDRAPLGLKLAAAAGLLFLHLPILLIFLYAFTTEEKSYQFPPPGLTLKWFAVAWGRADIWPPLWLSLQVAAVATLVQSSNAAALRNSAVRGRVIARGRLMRGSCLSGASRAAGSMRVCGVAINKIAYCARIDWLKRLFHQYP